MEVSIERSHRLMAPLPYVSEEMNSLDRILTNGTHLTDYEVLVNGERARGTTVVTWGPLKKQLALDITLLGVVAERQIRFAVESTGLASRFEASIDLIPLGRDETKLDTTAPSRSTAGWPPTCAASSTRWPRRYVDTMVRRVKARAKRRRLADARLLP